MYTMRYLAEDWECAKGALKDQLRLLETDPDSPMPAC